MSDPEGPLELGDDEIASVETFRRRKDTAVLTIMFTDIVGFTQLTEDRGEQHSNEVRRLHDEVLEAAITTGGAGVVIKHIGDAIMAIFAEPSTAVERALRIHEGLEELAKTRPDIDAIRVKIGLDMGQVTVEDDVDVDVFGRHANRASRVESLASGGQVLMTYTVFDSARSWLSTPKNAHLEWASHGSYRLKGVSAPVEVFEVADPDRGPLRPPRGGQRVRSVPGLAWAAALVLLGVGGTLAYGQFQPTELWLAQYAPPLSYLDAEELRLEGEPGDAERKVLLDVRPGMHVLHYDVADPVRYYAEINLERGENHIRPDFVESRIPTVYRFMALGEERAEATNEGMYHFYDENGTRVEHAATLAIAVDVTDAPADPGEIGVTFEWRIEIDGTVVSEDTRVVTRPPDATELREEFEVYSDGHHSYSILLRISGRTAHLDIMADFLAEVRTR